MPTMLLAALLAVTSLRSVSAAQTVATPTDPRAITLINEAQVALGKSSSDISLEANAEWIAGGTREQGTAKLAAKGTGQARLDIAAGAILRSEIRNDSDGPAGQWSGADGGHHAVAFHNCLGPAAWFAPEALIQLMLAQNGVLSYLGPEQRAGVAVDHLLFYPASSEHDPQLARTLEKLSTVEVFLDASSHLPVSVLFNLHPDDDEGRDIPVEVRFADYHSVDGVLVPFRLQRLLQGVLNLDLTVNAAQVNSGLSDDQFSLQ
jgi:hypothetical protein